MGHEHQEANPANSMVNIVATLAVMVHGVIQKLAGCRRFEAPGRFWIERDIRMIQKGSIASGLPQDALNAQASLKEWPMFLRRGLASSPAAKLSFYFAESKQIS